MAQRVWALVHRGCGPPGVPEPMPQKLIFQEIELELPNKNIKAAPLVAKVNGEINVTMPKSKCKMEHENKNEIIKDASIAATA